MNRMKIKHLAKYERGSDWTEAAQLLQPVASLLPRVRRVWRSRAPGQRQLLHRA